MSSPQNSNEYLYGGHSSVPRARAFYMKRTLPFNGKAVSEKSFSFSFACFDRSHELFNLGDTSATGTVSANWFLDLLDCLKSVSNMNISEMLTSLHDLHPVDWNKTNTSAPSALSRSRYCRV